MTINTQEYTHQLSQLQHGMITPEEWMAYCASIRKSIVVDTSYAEHNTHNTHVDHQESIPEHNNRSLV